MEISSWNAEYLQLQMLGSFVNGNASECWHHFPEEQQSLLLKMAHKYRLKPFYYRMLFQELPGELAANFKKVGKRGESAGILPASLPIFRPPASLSESGSWFVE